MIKKKKVISDIILNITASIIPIVALQFILLPIIASKINSEQYGQLLVIVGLMNLSAASLGNVLNNSKLIQYKRYQELNIEGDFSILLIIFAILNITIIIIGMVFFLKISSIFRIIAILIASILFLLINYTQVEFRINLNFKYILVNSFSLISGYIIGFVFFLIIGYWELIYVCGFIGSFIFLISKTSILKEPLKKTILFKSTLIQTISLLISGVLLGVAIYADKLLLYPLLGGSAVAIYYTSSIMGKSMMLVIQPISGVFLSYLSQRTKLNSINFKNLLLSNIFLGIIGYWLTIIISKPILSLLYPQFVDEALRYIYIITSTTIVLVIGNMINPVILKFFHSKWQIFINTIYLASYVLISLVLVEKYGLMGFCIGALAASIMKLVTMIVVYYTHINIRDKSIKAQ